LELLHEAGFLNAKGEANRRSDHGGAENADLTHTDRINAPLIHRREEAPR
jgi:hypothetical protein